MNRVILTVVAVAFLVPVFVVFWGCAGGLSDKGETAALRQVSPSLPRLPGASLHRG